MTPPDPVSCIRDFFPAIVSISWAPPPLSSRNLEHVASASDPLAYPSRGSRPPIMC